MNNDFANTRQSNEVLLAEMLTGLPAEKLLNWLQENGYYTAPAAKNHHGNFEGGLFEHSLQVTRELMIMTEQMGLQWSRPQSPVIVGMLHDICKCDQYIMQEDGSYEYNERMLYVGHGDKSCILAQACMELTDEELMCIRYHMGPYEGKEVWKAYNMAIKKYPNVLWTHTADMIASQIKGI